MTDPELWRRGNKASHREEEGEVGTEVEPETPAKTRNREWR